MSDLPKGWTKARIGEFAEIRLGKMLDKAKNQGEPVRYLRNINVRWFEFDLSDLQTILVTPDERELLSVRNGDLFICEGGEPGRCAVWRQGKNGLVYQKALHRIRTMTEIVPELLMYHLRHDAESGRLEDAFTGTTIKHLTRESLSSYKILLPPSKEQKRIANKLDALLVPLDACRVRLERVPFILKRFRQSVLATAYSGRLTADWRAGNPNVETGEALLYRIRQDRLKQELASRGRRKLSELPKPFSPNIVELPEIPATWAWASLGEIGEIVTGKTPSKKIERFWNGNIPFVMPEDLAKSEECLEIKVIERTKNYTTESGFNSVQNINQAAVLVCCIGTLGRVAVVKQIIAFSQQLNAIIPHPEMNLEYLAFYCHSIEPILRELWPQNTYLPIVNKTLFSSVPIPIPPAEEQKALVISIKEKMAQQKVMEKRGEKAKAYVDKLAQSILAKAFRGELVPQDPADEPASVLLERIRAERAAAELASKKTLPLSKRKKQASLFDEA